MLLKQIQYFVTVVRCHSFTEAAEECFVSQSAISQQITNLEQELGVKLLERSHRSFTLTPAGEYFYRHSLGILDEVERIRLETKQIGEYDDQHMIMGFLNGFGNKEIRQAIAQFGALYPEVTLDVKQGTHEELYKLLRSGEVDFVLNDQRRAFSASYVNYELTRSLCYIEISKLNPLAQLDYLTLEDLRRLPCVIVASKEQTDTEKEYYHNTLGFTGNMIVVPSEDAARILVAANKGFYPVDGKHLHRDETIISVPLYDGGKQMTRNYCLFWKKERTGYYIEEFSDILHKQFIQ